MGLAVGDSDPVLGIRDTAMFYHSDDVIMTTMASQITSLTIVCSTVSSGADQRKHQSSASLAFVWGLSPVTGEFPTQRASNAENVSTWWRHHGLGENEPTIYKEPMGCRPPHISRKWVQYDIYVTQDDSCDIIESAWWSLMGWCLTGAKTSATIAMT